jgi:hypothetical protein
MFNLSNKPWNFILESQDINTSIENFYLHLKTSIATIPTKTVFMSQSDKKWITPIIKILINERWSAFKENNFAKYTHLKMKVKQEIIKSKQKWASKMINEKSIWKVTKADNKSVNSINALLQSFPTKMDAANSINNCLSKFFSRPSSVKQNYTYREDVCPVITTSYVEKLLFQTKTKSTGSDLVPSIFYKIGCYILATPLAHIINLCFRNRSFPPCWKLAHIVPIPKTKPAIISDLRPTTYPCESLRKMPPPIL